MPSLCVLGVNSRRTSRNGIHGLHLWLSSLKGKLNLTGFRVRVSGFKRRNWEHVEYLSERQLQSNGRVEYLSERQVRSPTIVRSMSNTTNNLSPATVYRLPFTV